MASIVSHARHKILNFSPSWFSVNMGTGICSLILHSYPYQFKGLGVIARIYFGLNTFFFVIFLAISILRCILWPRLVMLVLGHKVQACFLGAFSMGLSTVTNGLAIFLPDFVDFTWALWWIGAVVAAAVSIGVLFLMMTRHSNVIEDITGVALLPLIASIVFSASGITVSEQLMLHGRYLDARTTIIASYIYLGGGVLLALLLMAVYMHRLILHGMPPLGVTVSAFLPIGPCGQSSFAILGLARQLDRIQSQSGVALVPGVDGTATATAIYGMSVVLAVLMTGLGFFWIFISTGTVIRAVIINENLPFNVGWWGFTFPLGTMALATSLLGEVLDSGFFRIVSAIYGLSVVILWIMVFCLSIRGTIKGTLFVSPCLKGSSLESLQPPLPKDLETSIEPQKTQTT